MKRTKFTGLVRYKRTRKSCLENQSSSNQPADFTVLANHRCKIKESEKL